MNWTTYSTKIMVDRLCGQKLCGPVAKWAQLSMFRSDSPFRRVLY